MIRTEPRLAWTTPAGATVPEPAPPRSRAGMGEALWGLALSVLFHAALVGGAGGLALATQNRALPTALEVAIVTAAPELDAKPPQPPQPAVDAPPTPTPKPEPPAPVPDKAETAKAETAKVEAAKAEPPAAPPPAPPPQQAAASSPTPPAPEATEAAPERPPVAKPAAPPPAHLEPRQQTAMRPPVVSGRGVTGSAHGTEHEADNGTIIHADVSPPPEYPRIAIQLGEEGTVYLAVEVGSDGLPRQVAVQRSSGFGSLDEAAVRAMQRWRFAPLHGAEQGKSVTIYVPMAFHLKHSGG
jgi:protein TonB